MHVVINARYAKLDKNFWPFNKYSENGVGFVRNFSRIGRTSEIDIGQFGGIFSKVFLHQF